MKQHIYTKVHDWVCQWLCYVFPKFGSNAGKFPRGKQVEKTCEIVNNLTMDCPMVSKLDMLVHYGTPEADDLL